MRKTERTKVNAKAKFSSNKIQRNITMVFIVLIMNDYQTI